MRVAAKGFVDRAQPYMYRGDRWTMPSLRFVRCYAVRRSTAGSRAGERPVCVRGRNGNMLVETESGTRLVVLARHLRKLAS
ncbi:MAG TPA: hypothetical protein VFV95_10245 [Vicinamibacterales bacterium]|nr:hypothetical protein [Vicinamibacterales bacterium]